MMRKTALVLTTLVFLYWLPADIESIRYGLHFQRELALGIALKIFMHVMALVGLARRADFGYVFLLGASVQGLIVSVSALRAVPPPDWWVHKGQLLIPAVDALIRLYCLAFVAYTYRHFLGFESTD